MEKWSGAAGICINTNGEILMVKQGTPDEVKRWSVPSGGMEDGESAEECCRREVEEETGYMVRVVRPLFVKHSLQDGYEVNVHYFEVEIIGGEAIIQDPDQLIHEITWQSIDDIRELDFSFPEDRKTILDYMRKAEARKST